MTLLVTGGAGFIGSNFILAWLASACEPVANLDRLTYAAAPEHLSPIESDARYRFVHGDIADRALVGDLLRDCRPRAILNFAAESHVDRSIRVPYDFVRTNVVGTFHLLDEALGYWRALPATERAAFRFLQVSTDEVYGSLAPGDPPFVETSPCAPNNPYAASKAAADHFVRAYGRTHGLPVLTARCCNNYGPHQFQEKLIPLATLRALAGETVPLYGDGGSVRDWIHVSDHCAALCELLARGRSGEIYHVGASAERRNVDVVYAICELLDEFVPDSPYRPHARLIRFVEDRPGHDRRYAIDSHKIRCELGWRPTQSFELGLRRTVAWYVANREWCGRARDRTQRGAAS